MKPHVICHMCTTLDGRIMADRWPRLRGVAGAAELVLEVRFDQVTDDRFRHGTRLLRWRPDKAPGQCTFEPSR
jgi:ATP-dependent DNA ligase